MGMGGWGVVVVVVVFGKFYLKLVKFEFKFLSTKTNF